MQPDNCSDFEVIKAMLLQVGYYVESKECIAFVSRNYHSRIHNIQEDTIPLKPCNQFRPHQV
jgi:hypothetical protein